MFDVLVCHRKKLWGNHADSSSNSAVINFVSASADDFAPFHGCANNLTRSTARALPDLLPSYFSGVLDYLVARLVRHRSFLVAGMPEL
jgi:hypothetical protein